MGGSNLWDAEWEVSEDLARKLITTQFPQLAHLTVQQIGYGWDNTVYLVGDQIVFRFPRRKVAIDLLQMEGKLLPLLEAFMPLPYSKPLYFGVKSFEYPAPFLGYPYLTGKFPIGLTDEQRTGSVPILAQFLKRLHAFPVDIANENGIQHDHRK